MSRTIIYPGGPAGVKRAAVAGGPAPVADGISEKLLKFIPGETIAFYVPIYALVPKDPVWGHWLIVGVAAIGGLGYLYARADKTAPPRFYFYILAVIAFLAWAVGTSTAGTDLLGLPDWVNQVAIPGAVFLVPMADEVVTKICDRVAKVQS